MRQFLQYQNFFFEFLQNRFTQPTAAVWQKEFLYSNLNLPRLIQNVELPRYFVLVAACLDGGRLGVLGLGGRGFREGMVER
jgi:hypothetical protein